MKYTIYKKEDVPAAVFRNKGEYYGAKKPYPIDRPVWTDDDAGLF